MANIGNGRSCILYLSIIGLILVGPEVEGATRKGDAFIVKARAEAMKDTTAALDAAYQLAVEAWETDRNDVGYQLEMNRLRAFAAQYHVYDGQVARDSGKLGESQKQFEKAVELDPASVVATQELARVKASIAKIGKDTTTDLESLERPLPRKRTEDLRMFANATQVPGLHIKLTQPLPVIKVNDQLSGEIFLTLCKDAKVRVLFDSEYLPHGLGLNQTLDLHNLSLEQALDYLALISKSFWKPLSSDTIFVANDDPLRRSTYEEQVTKAFFLTNSQSADSVNEIAGTVQRVTDMKKLFVHPAQGVIIARGDADRVALAEKVVSDLDKAPAEIIIDVIILSVSKDWTRKIGVNLGIDGTVATFAPGGIIPQAGAVGTTTLKNLPNLTTKDFNITLPSATLSALLTVDGTKMLDKAELRTVEGQKSSLKIGQKVPYATGSFASSAATAVGGVNTQFQYFDVGLNIDVLARVHEPDEVSLHIESDTSSVASYSNVGGISQPVIAQRSRVADVRVKEGEINFWDIVTERQDVVNSTGTPGLSNIPLLGRLFKQEQLQKTEQQVLTLLIPHIIRAPDIRTVNLMGVPSGNDQVVRMRYREDAAAVPTGELRTIELPKGPPPPPIPTYPNGMPGANPGYQPTMPGMNPMPGMYPMPGVNQMPGVNPMPGLAPTPGLNQTPILNTTPGLSQTPVLNTTPGANQMPGSSPNRNTVPGSTQPPVPH